MSDESGRSEVFAIPFSGKGPRTFDVSADGQRFLFIRADPQSRPTRIDLILNWFPELARLVKR